MAAKRLISELEDILDTIDLKISRLKKNYENLKISKSQKECEKLIKSMERDYEKIDGDIKFA